MNVRPTALAGVVVVDTQPFIDQRGAFARFFCERDLGAVMDGRHIVQINFSRTAAVGAVRGLHFQFRPHAEMKLVRCVKGRVWDVALDLRAGSPTFLRWHAEELTPENARMVVVPEGFAHGYQILEPDSELVYCTTALYAPEHEGGVSYSDPRAALTWPVSVTDLSVKDRRHAPLAPDFAGLRT